MKKTGKISLLLLCALSALSAGNIQCGEDGRSSGKTKEKIEGVEMNGLAISTYFADHRRSCHFPFNSQSKGSLLWIAPAGFSAGEIPQAVFIWNKAIVIEALSEVHVFSTDGRFLFKKEKAHGTRIGISGEYLFFQDGNYWLGAVDFSGKQVMEEADFPHSTSNDFPVSLFAPGERDFLAVIQYTGGAQDLPPEVYVEKAEYGQVLPEWTWKAEGKQALFPLYVSELGRVVIFLDEIVIIDSGSGEEITRVSLDFEGLFNCSAGADGNIYLSGADDEGPYLAAMAIDGKELWRWKAHPGEKIVDIHPPIVGAGGEICVLMERSVHAIIGGELEWSFEAESGVFSYAAALADGTFLVTSGKKLFRLGSEGEMIFEFEAEMNIDAPPAVDGNGDIILVSGGKIIKVG